MSADAMGWVFRHSPYRGAVRLVHLAIADSVNDQHENELWMAVGNLAAKAQVARKTAGLALAELVAGGFLEVLESPRSGRDATGKVARYRFLFPDVEVQFETRPRRSVPVDNPEEGESSLLTPGESPLLTGCVLTTHGVSPDDSLTQSNPSKNPSTSRDDSETVDNSSRSGNGQGAPSDPREDEFARRWESLEDEFASWWERYPRKVNRQAAWKVFRARRREGVPLESLVSARDHYRRSRQGEDMQFTRHGSTFLALDGPWSEWVAGPPEGERVREFVDDPDALTRGRPSVLDDGVVWDADAATRAVPR